MATNISQCQGRYVAYSQDVDRVFSSKHSEIEKFKLEKVQELIKENPFNLENPSGRKIAQATISDEVESEISELAGPIFKEVRKDIAFAVLSSYMCSK